MKRDMELIKAILLSIEENCDGRKSYHPTRDSVKYEYSGTDAEFERHCHLIAEHKLAHAITDLRSGIVFLALTWEGHDFLDSAREPKVWDTVKGYAGKVSFAVLCAIMERLALKLAENQLVF